MVYAIGFAVIKYTVGYSIVPGLGSAYHHSVASTSSLNRLSLSYPHTILDMARKISKGHFSFSAHLFDRLGTLDVSFHWFPWIAILTNVVIYPVSNRVTHLEGECRINLSKPLDTDSEFSELPLFPLNPELCFWLFLVNAGSVQQDWFRSLYFKTWVIGSVAAVIYMPIVTIFTRSNPLKV